MIHPQNCFRSHLDYIHSIVRNDGPDPNQYDEHLAWYTGLNAQIEQGEIGEPERDIMRDAFGKAYTAETLQGHVWERPLGYAGDFEIIEKIYNYHVSSDPRCRKYDEFFQSQASPQAVRNRKNYFKQLIIELCSQADDEPIEVLNLACGPCREIKELFDESPSLPVNFFCVDVDTRAIEYAGKLLGRHKDRVHFEKANILRFKPKKPYSLIWSAGLFDYFDDRAFARILKRYVASLAPSGQVAIGNFGEQNSTKGYMEAIGKWYLHHRSDQRLTQLAKEAGAVAKQHKIAVYHEPTGVNRFLHIQRSSEIRIDHAHRSIRPPRIKRVSASNSPEYTNE